ncbi:hypothetical protein CRE_09744 [Caenorhabditis remanei]|uniref:Uncharacterized protein n=1 Tax=Caenorhabditis remanei TaxID=31234 RepID=E3N4Z5_CAERE|nr:hypothetical protein CRE_09744 [Caenorhabditis remanei]
MEMFIRCDPSIPIWCAKFRIYEMDLIIDTIIAGKSFCTHKRERNFLLTNATLGGDKGTNHYEFNYMIEHNCTSSGSTRCLFDGNNEVSVSVSRRHYVEFHQALFNRGDDNDHCHF